MNVDKKMILKIVVGLAITFTCGLVLLYLTDFGVGIRYFIKESKKSGQRNVRLLSETDHQSLLESCRELSRQVARGDLKPGRYRIRRDPDPDTSQFPQPILNLEPTYVYIYDNGRVMVELGGGMHHFGVYGYPEDYKEPTSIFEYGDKKLIDGLWYYADGYNPEYDKKIDALLQKGKKAH